MKKIISIMVILVMLFSAAYAAGFEIEDNPDYKAALTNRLPFSSCTPVDFNTKATSTFYVYDSTCFPNSVFSWERGASGEEGDFAPSVNVATGARTTNFADGIDRLYMFYQGPNGKLYDGGGTIYISYDIKLNTTCDRLNMSDLPLWNQGGDEYAWVLFDSNGTVAGTDFPYSANEWMHIEMQYNVDDNLWNMWIDGEKAVDNRSAKGNFFNLKTRLCFLIRQMTDKQDGEARAGFTVDNVLAYAVGKDIGSKLSLSFSDKNGGVYPDAAPCKDAVIKLSGNVLLQHSELANSENIVIVNDSGAQIPYEGELSGNTYSMTPGRTLMPGEQYSVRISDEIREAENSYRPASGHLNFMTMNDKENRIGVCEIEGKDFSEIAPGETVDIDVKVERTTASEQSLSAMAALYNNENGMAAFMRQNFTVDSVTGTTGLTFIAPADFSAEKYTLRVYLTKADSIALLDYVEIK